jgi:hypothetical protein
MFTWLEVHYWKAATLLVAAFFGILYGLNYFETPSPLDKGFAYLAMRDHFQRIEVFDETADLNFASSRIVEHHGEAILSGTGSARSLHPERFELPVFEQVDMEFLVIVTRNCLGQTASCYSVGEMTLTREASVWPVI